MPVQEIAAGKDAYVDEASPGANNGGAATLFVRSSAAANRRTLLSFNLGNLPASAAEIVSATLRLVPTAHSATARTLRCLALAADFSETAVTWNDQPATGTDHGTDASGDNPQTWVVTSSVAAAFPGGLVGFLVKDDAEGSALAQEQEYASRESAGQEAVLEVTFVQKDHADLPSSVTPEFTDAADLPAAVVARRSSARFGQLKRVALLAASGGATRPNGVAYDGVRDALWVADQTNRKLRRYSAHSLALEQEYDIPGGFEPVGCAFDGEFLWLSDDASLTMTIRKFSIGASALAQEASYEHDFRTVLAWDGATLWSADTIGQVVYRHNLDATLSVAEAFGGLPEVWGLAFPGDGDDPYLLENLNSTTPDFRIRKRRAADLAVLQTFDYRGADGERPFGLAFVPGPEAGKVVTVEEIAGDALVWTHGDLPSTVRPANIPRHADLVSSIRPANIRGTADLDSLLVVNVPGQVHLASTVRPRFSRFATLPSTIAPTEFPVSTRARVTGVVGALVVVDARDFRDISAEVGSTIEWTRAGVARTLRRVVQIVDTQDAKTFPRARTSEHGRASTQDQLRRGDAVLFATGDDDFRPGDRVTWQGRTWEVVGLVGAEMVGNVRIYEEVGLRRLPVVSTGRVIGTVGP